MFKYDLMPHTYHEYQTRADESVSYSTEGLILIIQIFIPPQKLLAANAAEVTVHIINMF